MRKIPVTKPYFDDEEKKLIGESLDSGWVAQGPKVAEFEKIMAEHEGVSEAIATTSCTTALHLAMVAQGMTSGMDVMVPAFTFVATANSVTMTGATPVLVDIDKKTFNIDVTNIRKTIDEDYINKDGKLVNKKTNNILWGIVPVHQFGLCCDIYAINKIAKEYNLKIIEDAACALGSKIGDAHPGSFGNVACVSFHPRKSITTGEGGMIFTNDVALAKKMRELRSHGSSISADVRDKGNGFLLPEFNDAGYNYRMTDIQGALGIAQSKKLDFIIEKKRQCVSRYNELITHNLPEFITPVEDNNYFHTYQSYVCLLDLNRLQVSSLQEGEQLRNNLLKSLENNGIATRQGTHAVHTLNYYKKKFSYNYEDYSNSYECDKLSMSLPLYCGLEKDDQEYIVNNIKRIVRNM